MIYAPISHGPLMEILNTHALFERVSLHNWLQGIKLNLTWQVISHLTDATAYQYS
jgi:hypothetical protein